MCKEWIKGDVTSDVTMCTTPNGVSIAEFEVSYSPIDTLPDEEYHIYVLTYGVKADFAKTYLGKGKMVYIEGNIYLDSYQPEGGGYRYIFVADTIDIMKEGVNDC